MLEKLSTSKCKRTFLVRIEQLKMRYQLKDSLLSKGENHRSQGDRTILVCTKLDIKMADRQVEADKLQSEMEWRYQWLQSLRPALPAFLQERKNWTKNRNKLHKEERMLLDMAIVDGQQTLRVQVEVDLGREARISLGQNQML